LDVTLDVVSGGHVFFPRVCSKCLAPNPEHTFKIGAGQQTSARTITTWSFDKVPICNSCYRRKYWTLSSVLRIIGWFLLLLGFIPGLFIFSLFLPVQENYGLAFIFPGIGLATLIGVTIYRASNPRPVKMQKTKHGMKFSFENPEYATMFMRANGR
jgi:hypothetical protein